MDRSIEPPTVRERSDLPELRHVPPEVVDLLTAYVGIDSDAWPRLDQLLADRLRRPGHGASRSHGARAPQGAVSSDRSPGCSTRPVPPAGATGRVPGSRAASAPSTAVPGHDAPGRP